VSERTSPSGTPSGEGKVAAALELVLGSRFAGTWPDPRADIRQVLVFDAAPADTDLVRSTLGDSAAIVRPAQYCWPSSRVANPWMLPWRRLVRLGQAGAAAAGGGQCQTGEEDDGSEGG